MTKKKMYARRYQRWFSDSISIGWIPRQRARRMAICFLRSRRTRSVMVLGIFFLGGKFSGCPSHHKCGRKNFHRNFVANFVGDWSKLSQPIEISHLLFQLKFHPRIPIFWRSVKYFQPPRKTPWRKILTSLPLWAIFMAHLGQNWGFWTLATQMPNYIDSVFEVHIKEVSSTWTQS